MSKYIIGITGCPTGIAHTFMAKESIEKAANSLGYKVKVETNGQEGRKNEITYEDLKNADALIVAADIGVDVERFLNFGVPVLQTTTKNALNENAAKKLINDALSLNPEGSKSNIPEDKVEKITIGQKIYKDLMSGVSNMLPFVVGGGILIALSFLWGIFSADPTNAQYNEFAAMLMKIGQQAFGIMVPVFTAYIA
ncbi:MAG: PTS fructose transporter subunit IIC, partial [Erysipelotrichia bacterium]|nr:PTS fructose transporter subunit IIC [Erysipelotrichia bacterium]